MIANTLLNCALWVRMQVLRWTHWRPFVHAAKHPGQIQRALLQQLLRRNTTTRFGREHHLNTVSNYDDFIGAVPVQTYETLRPYIEDKSRLANRRLTLRSRLCTRRRVERLGKRS